ncbi:hypothetical protein BVC80_8989g36 [Macleaya cordata]|uniref:SLH domain-containing protein n=1 Tax=Macleaya cordata TaxID=56857 RepID=A0A200Q8E4_MACCD|nr:hypothetical protein BVC80_8989g36 [Macleaya cordata]
MSSSSLSASSSPFLFIDNHRCDLRRWDVSSSSSSIFVSSNPIVNLRISKHRRVHLYASVSERKTLEASWFPPDRNSSDDYGGWEIIETGFKADKKKKGFPNFLLVGVGASFAILLGAIAYCSFSRKGLNFQFSSPLRTLQRMLTTSDSTSRDAVADSNTSNLGSIVSNASPGYISDKTSEIPASASVEKLKRVVIPAAADTTQQESLLVLKKLKIIEDDVKEDELCTRREYARWLVKANSVLERNPKHRISPAMLLAGSLFEAFDDVNIEDPDFWSVQALAEAGLVHSRLSGPSSSSSDPDGFTVEEGINFLPESFISRFDLLNWKAQLDYSSMPGIEEKISRKKVGLMDVRAISQDASAALFMDMLAGDNSVLRKVFGQSRRFQPHKPATKAQAAVALTRGRMARGISTLLSRIEAEDSSRKVEMEEIRSELLSRGEIQKFWEVKMNEVKACAVEAEKHFHTAILTLKQEKDVQNKSQGEYLKEKAALDCQRQLLLRLKEEVNEMSERLISERATFVAEQKDLENMSNDLQAKQEEIIEVKSILEAEIEALRILRSWVEDEARRNQARAQVLEEVGRRWRWEDQD